VLNVAGGNAHGAIISANVATNNSAPPNNVLAHGAVISANVSANNANYPSGVAAHGAIISGNVSTNNANAPSGVLAHGQVISRLVSTCNPPGCTGGVTGGGTHSPVFMQDAVVRLIAVPGGGASCEADVEFEVNGMRIGRSKPAREWRFTVPAGSGNLDFRARSGSEASPIAHVAAGAAPGQPIELKIDSLCKATQSDGNSDSKEKQQ
jgi:hypothetical protein